MIFRLIYFVAVLTAFGAASVTAQTGTANPAKGGGVEAAAVSGPRAVASGDKAEAFVPVTKFDPARDAATDIKLAVKEAARTGKRVLIDVGGEWCIWCHRMDEFLTANPTLLKLRDDNFVMVKVNYSEENKNEALIASYGKVEGYPHLFVLDSDGTVLHSQDTGKLEDGGKSYTLATFEAFLKAWAPPAK